MSEMIERVVEAIRECDYALTGGEARTYAIAAIKAMREPTDEMFEVGEQAMYDAAPDWKVNASWRAMVEAALSTQPQEER